MSDTTFMAKAGEVERKWFVVDASGQTLGRLASQVATILRGKHKATFTPHVDCGDHVIVINADQLVLTGKKAEKKFYRYHTGYIGGLKEISYGKLLESKSDFMFTLAVKGMLPKNKLGRQMIKKLRVYKDAQHPHQAQAPVELSLHSRKG